MRQELRCECWWSKTKSISPTGCGAGGKPARFTVDAATSTTTVGTFAWYRIGIAVVTASLLVTGVL